MRLFPLLIGGYYVGQSSAGSGRLDAARVFEKSERPSAFAYLR